MLVELHTVFCISTDLILHLPSAHFVSSRAQPWWAIPWGHQAIVDLYLVPLHHSTFNSIPFQSSPSIPPFQSTDTHRRDIAIEPSLVNSHRFSIAETPSAKDRAFASELRDLGTRCLWFLTVRCSLFGIFTCKAASHRKGGYSSTVACSTRSDVNGTIVPTQRHSPRVMGGMSISTHPHSRHIHGIREQRTPTWDIKPSINYGRLSTPTRQIRLLFLFFF